jgi:predicted transcriptional regulator of viral defense system
MKTTINITVDDTLLNSIQAYASSKQTSVSELVAGYFRRITRPAKRQNILHLVDKLETPDIDFKSDLKSAFYQDQFKKYNSLSS